MREVLEELRPSYAYTGMALGTDQDFAQLCVDLKIPFCAAVPFEGQEAIWPEKSQRVYWDLMSKARERQVICEPGYAAWKMFRRNEFMIEEIGADGVVIAVFNGRPGGTAGTVNYAQKAQRRIIRIDPLTRLIHR